MDYKPPKPFPEGVLLVFWLILGAVMVLAGLVWFSGLSKSDEIGDVASETPSTLSGSTLTPNERDSTIVPEDEGSEQDDQPSSSEDDEDSIEDEPENEPDNEPNDEPDSPLNFDPAECPDQTPTEICEAALFVQSRRGRAFKRFPEVSIVTPAELNDFIVDSLESEQEDLEDDDVAFTALGLIDPSVDLYQTLSESFGAGVLGVFDTETEELLVKGDTLNLFQQRVVVHELVHAFDHQWFDLDRDFDNDDTAYGFSALVEGNASRVEEAWVQRLNSAQRAEMIRQELASLSPGDLQKILAIPAVILGLVQAPYTSGETYVSRLASDGGEDAVDDAFASPPISSEEIEHFDPDPVVELGFPSAPDGVVDQGRLGELIVTAWLGPEAGVGWGGDSYTAWIDSSGSNCINVDLVGDDGNHSNEILDAARAWAAISPIDRSANDTTVDGVELVRVTGCAG